MLKTAIFLFGAGFMLALELKIDGGAREYSIALDALGDGLRDMSGLFQAFVNWFEKGQAKVRVGESPIVEIFRTEGQVINGNWELSPRYSDWKERNWDQVRQYNVPLTNMNKQILTGKFLYALTSHDDPYAVRTITPTSMEYGTNLPYVNESQQTRKVLDFYAEMEKGMNHITAKWISEIKGAERAQVTGDE